MKKYMTTYLNSSLHTLHLDRLGLPDTILLHIRQSAGITVDTPRALALGVLGAQVGKDSNRALACILDKSPRNHLERLCDGLVRPLLDSLDALGHL